jgi:RNA polymerase sigma-70 factor (ECF subfamily)
MLLSLLRGAGGRPGLPPRLGERRVPRVEEPTDEALVRRARSGEERAAAELYRRHVHYVLGLATRLMGHRGDGEDVTQDAFAVALERLATLEDPGAFRAWAAQIAVNLVRKRLRRRRLGRLLGVDGGTPDATLEALAVASSVEAHAELALLDVALAELPTEQRIAWMLRYVEGERLENVAAACGCSLATAKRRIGRASARVAIHVGFVDAEGEGGQE